MSPPPRPMRRMLRCATLRLPVLTWLAAGVCACAAAGPARACGEDPPAAITSDTPEYCDYLQNMIATRANAAVDVRHLVQEGRRECDHGDVRAGIARLRRALLILRHAARPIAVAAPPH